MKVGDVITVAGIKEVRRNPARKWWQFWKPKYVATGELQRFMIVEKVK